MSWGQGSQFDWQKYYEKSQGQDDSNPFSYLFGGRDNLMTSKSLSEDIFGRTTGGGGIFDPQGNLQRQMKGMGDAWNFGKQFGSISDIAGKLDFSKIGSIGDIAKGAWSFAKGGLGALSAGIKANPVGALFTVGSKLLGAGSKAKEAQIKDRAMRDQQDKYREAQGEATVHRDVVGDINEQGRDIGLFQGLGKVSDQADLVAIKTEQDYLKTGGLETSGEIEFKEEKQEESLDELAALVEDQQTQLFQKGEAEADAKLDSFMDETNKAIAELGRQRSSLKTKWYQNVSIV